MPCQVTDPATCGRQSVASDGKPPVLCINYSLRLRRESGDCEREYVRTQSII